MNQDPQAIKREIEDTRERLGDTVEALAYKTDVPARAKDALNERVESVKGTVSDVVDSAKAALGGATTSIHAATSNASDAVTHAQTAVGDAASQARSQLPSGTEAKARVRSIRSRIERNPLGLGFGSIAIGFLIGSLLPVSEIERDKVGAMGEQLVDNAKSAASSVVEQGKAAVTQAVGDALGGAKA